MAKKKPAGKNKGKKDYDKTIEQLRQFIRSEGSRYLSDPNITSVGIGHKVTKGKRTKELCLQFTVRSKLEDAGALPEGMQTSLIPESLTVDGKSIPTDVIEREYRPSFELVNPETNAENLSERKRRVDPLKPGVSVSHPSGTAGTLGLIVYDRLSGTPYMLSNWHVLHQAAGQLGDTVVQPGPFDDNRVDENSAGILKRSHLGPAGDCAIATIEDRRFETEILELGVTPIQLARVDLGDHVIKSGRTSGVTKGIVRRIDVLASISYSGVGEVEIGAFEIEPIPGTPDHEISEPGDSGCAWVIAKKKWDTDRHLGGAALCWGRSEQPRRACIGMLCSFCGQETGSGAGSTVRERIGCGPGIQQQIPQ